MEVPYCDLNFNGKIEKIYHLSDIHIRLQKRHEEYRSVFEKLYISLKKEIGSNNKNGIIVITGDILHSKTELSPECVSLTASLFENLAKILPLVIIAGNHDANLNNQNRMDSLTPIVEKVIRKSECYYLRQSGVYKMGNLGLGITSVFDYNFIKSSDIDGLNLGIDYKVALFHGRVDGAITDTGTIMKGENGINKKSFDGYDYVMLGDIHKHQFLDKNRMAYAGSLIQQNHGESLNNHGYIIWDLVNKKTNLVEIKSDYGYASLKIKDGKIYKNGDLPKNCYLRLEVDNKTNNQTQSKIINDLKTKMKLSILEITTMESTEDEKTDNDIKSLTFNVSNDQFQNQEIEKFLKMKNIDDNTIDKIKTLNSEYNKKVSFNNLVSNASWKIKKLEFSNLFCYGDKNIIDFTNFKGITGIVAPNHTGKSAIIDVILYTLFEKTSRKGTAKDILRIGQKTFKSMLEIEMGGLLYIIKKNGTLKPNGVMSVKIDFNSYKDGKRNSLNGHTPVETRKIIESYFGTFDDMVMTSVSLQNNNTQFADSKTTDRKKEFEKLLRIDIFEKIKDLVASDVREIKGVVKHLTSQVPEDGLSRLFHDHTELEKQLEEIEDNLKESKVELQELRQNESGLMVQRSELVNKISDNHRKILEKGELNGYLEKLRNQIKNNKTNLDNSIDYDKIDLDQQREEKEKYDKIESKIRKLIKDIHPIKDIAKPKDPLKTIKTKLEKTQDKKNKLKIKLKKLEGCDWEEKELISSTISQIINEHKKKYPSEGDLINFYIDLDKTSQKILDKKYQPGDQESLDKVKIELSKILKTENTLNKTILVWDQYQTQEDNKKDNEIVNNQIKELEIKKKKINMIDLDMYFKYQKIKKMEDEEKEIVKIFDILEEYQDKENKLKKTLSDIIELEEYIEEVEKRRGDLKGSIGVVVTEMKVFKEKQAELENKINRQSILTIYLDCLKKIPFYIINKVIPRLEKTINQMLISLTNFTLKFDVSESNLNVYICLKDGNIPLSNTSGFEKFVGSLFLRLGLIKMSNLPKANFLAIDEGWGNFDSDNLNNTNIIMDYLRNEFNFVLLMSHLPVMREQLDKQMIIDKSKGDLSHVCYPKDISNIKDDLGILSN